MNREPETESLEGKDAMVYVALTKNPVSEHFIDPQYIQRLVNIGLNGKVLDVGCGPGQIIQHLSYRPNLELVGVDLSNTMIDYAQDQNERGNVKYQVANATELPFDDISFDSVVSHFFIEHLQSEQDVIKTFNEMHRVVKPNGIIYVEDIIRPENEEILQAYLARTGYDPECQQNYEDSIRAAFSHKEWNEMVQASDLVKSVSDMPKTITQLETGILSLEGLPSYQYVSRRNIDFLAKYL